MQEIINTQPIEDREGYDVRFTQLASGAFEGAFLGTRLRDDALLKGLATLGDEDLDLAPARRILVANRQHFGARLRIDGQSMKNRTGYYLVTPPAGLARARGVELRPGDLVEVPPASEMDFVTEQVSISCVILRNDVRDSIHRSTGHRSAPGALRLAPASSARLAAAITSHLEGHASGGGERHFERLLEEEFASCLANANPGPGPRVRAEGRRRAVRRAEEYLREHLSGPVSTHSLAELAGVPLRTLQHGFKDEFGISAYALHARLRLQAARRRLEQRTLDSDRITEVALDFGFHHFGRFSADYRRLFGESPSGTLRRRRPHHN